MSQPPTYPFQNPDLPLVERVDDLLSRLSVEEKAQQMLHTSPAIERLGIPAYNWWNEALHGVARAGVATVFPQAVGLAAMWSTDRMHEIACVIADEARAKHHEFLRRGDRGMYKGLTFWSPNINILRDPRWGRGHETYGECPFLTGRLGVAFCNGLQREQDGYLAVIATPKHFAVHSGPEDLRHSFDARVSVKDLRETYLPAFADCVREAKAGSVMAAYNRTNGEPCCASPTLLEEILRQEWGFDGYVVSDCWAVVDFHQHHGVTETPAESAAAAVRAGCDLNCGCTYEHLPLAVEQGLLTEADLDVALRRLFSARMRLGMFDPPERVPFAAIPYDVNASEKHRQLALEAARESIVLLKNDGVLPLDKHLDRIAVIGPNAANDHVLVANYYGVPTHVVTPLEGIRAKVSAETKVLYTDGCALVGDAEDGVHRAGNLSEALSVASRADAVVLVLGLSAEIEGEEGDAGNVDAGGDKGDLSLTGLQQKMLEQVVALGKPTVLVLIAGSAVDLSWAQEHVGAIALAWYPGETGGTAIADVLFGDYNPGGRLPLTFPRSIDDVPPFTDYAMKGRTYRYAEREPLYPFGFGLSYCRFDYSELELSTTVVDGDTVGPLPTVPGPLPTVPDEAVMTVSVTVKNAGAVVADEVVQLYVKDVEASCAAPLHSLRGFQRLRLAAGEARRVVFELSLRDLSMIDEAGKRVVEPGLFRISVGGSQPDARSEQLLGTAPLTAELRVAGRRRELAY